MKNRVLLAEGDDAVRRMIARVLESFGYAPLLTSSGLEAVSSLRAGQADLAVAELKVPDERGWDDLQQLREAAPSVPVIAITAWPNQHEQAIERGILLLEKPLDMTALLDQIDTLLSQGNQQPLEQRQAEDTTAKASCLGKAA